MWVVIVMPIDILFHDCQQTEWTLRTGIKHMRCVIEGLIGMIVNWLKSTGRNSYHKVTNEGRSVCVRESY